MSTARPFAYNLGSPITGTEQVGNLAIGTPTNGFDSTGLQWWNGPNEDLGYVIAHQTPNGSQPNPLLISAYLGFWRSKSLTEQSFINLAEYVSNYINDPQIFANGTQAKTWLNGKGYWTSYDLPQSTPTPTPTPTVTTTPTKTPTNTPTPSVTPQPITGYGYNLVVLPYNPPTSGNTIFPTFATPGLNSILWKFLDASKSS